MYETTSAEDHIAKAVVDAAFKVHSALGPGLMESTYELCLMHELDRRNIAVSRQVPVPVVYEDLRLEAAYRIDILVGGLVIVEIKAVERMNPIHQAQLLTYLKLADKHLGLLINFNVARIRDGIQRLVR
ncbi:MAG: GxxExxY protein [Magnetospirillum sp.]|nr:GxxExxY protein [Magnetospirillum sp.]